MSRGWRFLDTGVAGPAENLAWDEALLACCDAGTAPNTVRLLEWSAPCALVGFNQAVSLEVREDFCRQHGVEINRRITGGGAILCGPGQLGWEIVARKDTPGLPRRPEDLYRLFCDGAVRGLRFLGLDAEFRPRNDIEVGGRKISGTGGTEKREAFLFQGTLLVEFDAEAMVQALRVPAEKLQAKEIDSIRERVTWLGRELNPVPGVETIKMSLVRGLEAELGVTLRDGDLLEEERRLHAQLVPRFRSRDWVYATKRPCLDRLELRGVYKSPGGLIRVSLMVDARAQRIKQILISGDFFTYPARAVLDLEATLKDAPYHPQRLRAIVRDFFADEVVTVPGCTPEDFCLAIEAALRRTVLLDQGLDVDETNAVTPVVTDWLRADGEVVLLLPYCAKRCECEWRAQDGCAQCGLCSVGEAYALAEKFTLRAVSINNYEELRAVLERERDAGVSGFVGCCCDAFYAKHADDFARIGLPGVLIDIDNTTCYELGLLRQAKAGGFGQQTELKVGLLEKILNLVVPAAARRAASCKAAG